MYAMGSRARYFTIRNRDTEKGLSLLAQGLEKDLSTPSSSMRLSTLARAPIAACIAESHDPLKDRQPLMQAGSIKNQISICLCSCKQHATEGGEVQDQG